MTDTQEPFRSTAVSATTVTPVCRKTGAQMTPDQLRTVGELIYGYGWQSEMARERGIHLRTVRHWLVGRNRMPADLAAWLQVQINARRAELNAAERILPTTPTELRDVG